MTVRLTIILATLCMLAWTSPAQARMERVCPGAHPAGKELACGKANLHRATSMLRFLRMYPKAGTRHNRAILERDAKWLQKYALRHISRAQSRIHPAVDGCTDKLLRREGGYNPHKWNGGYVGPWESGDNHGGSGAYGGPQALPGSKMRSAGADWRDNIWTQIRWMRGYMNSKYGGSCNALAFSYANGYY